MPVVIQDVGLRLAGLATFDRISGINLKKLFFLTLLPALLLFSACKSETVSRTVFSQASSSGEALLRKVPSNENLAVVLLNPQEMRKVAQLRIDSDSLFGGIETLFEPRTGIARQTTTLGSSTNVVAAIIEPRIESVTTIVNGSFSGFHVSNDTGESYRNIFISDGQVEQARVFSSFVDKQTFVFGPAQTTVKSVIDTIKDKRSSAYGQMEAAFGHIDIGFLMLIQSGEANQESAPLNLKGLTITAVSANVVDDASSSVTYYLAFDVETDAVAAENNLSSIQRLAVLTGLSRISNYELKRTNKVLIVKFNVPHAEVAKL